MNSKRKKRLKSKTGGKCGYCGCDFGSTLDHIYPKSKGGTDFDGNLIGCCQSCNVIKDNLSVQEFREKICKLVNNPLIKFNLPLEKQIHPTEITFYYEKLIGKKFEEIMFVCSELIKVVIDKEVINKVDYYFCKFKLYRDLRRNFFWAWRKFKKKVLTSGPFELLSIAK